MIPHPLTLLFCYLLGQMAAQAIGTVLDFAMQVLFDFRRFGWLSPGGLILAVRVLGSCVCERERHRPGLQDARGFLRGWMLWER